MLVAHHTPFFKTSCSINWRIRNPAAAGFWGGPSPCRAFLRPGRPHKCSATDSRSAAPCSAWLPQSAVSHPACSPANPDLKPLISLLPGADTQHAGEIVFREHSFQQEGFNSSLQALGTLRKEDISGDAGSEVAYLLDVLLDALEFGGLGKAVLEEEGADVLNGVTRTADALDFVTRAIRAAWIADAVAVVPIRVLQQTRMKHHHIFALYFAS